MEYAHVILASLFSILALFLITKLLGCRQMNQLSMFDYINGITIGSIAAELAASWGKEFWQWAIALVIYGLATFLLSLATDRSIQARRLITGTPIPLYENGQLLDQNFRRAKLDLNEFLMQCRLAGYFDLSQLETAQGCQAADVFLALYDPTTEAVQVYRRSGGKEEDKLE